MVKIVNANPLTNYLTMFRNVMMNHTVFEAKDLVIGVIEACVAMLVGMYVFYRNQDTFILNL